MCMCDVSSQTDMCLTAYVMDGYPWCIHFYFDFLVSGRFVDS